MIDDIVPPGPPEQPNKNAPRSEKPPKTTELPKKEASENTDSHPAEFAISGHKYVKDRRSFRIWPSHLAKKWQILIGAGIFLVTAGVIGGILWYQHTHKPKVTKPVVVTKKAPPPAPTTVASPLTGVQVTPELAKHIVTGVMIENSPDARPQSGLKDAGVVYEAIAEGGITRFLALFQEATPDYIGPARSARPYYLDWVLPYDAGYAHVGGSPEALAQIKQLGIKDMDQFYNSAYYWRVSNRYAPHNMYTSIAKLNEGEAKKGWTTSNFTGFARKAKEEPAATPTAKSIDFAISSYLYNVHYDYDAATNSYLRSEGGKPHMDEKSNSQLAPKVVIALGMHHSIEADGYHSAYATVGSGPMFVFQDGVQTQGTWTKADRGSQFTFTDANGKPLKLNPGQTWITMVEGASSITAQ